MENTFYTVFIHFIEKVGMQAVYSGATYTVSLAFILSAFLFCYIGVKFFRTMSAVTMFIMVAIFLIAVMKKATIGEVVTAFTLIGIVAAAITFKWYHLSAFISAFYIGYSLAATIFEPMWVGIAIGVVLGVLVNIYPIITMMIITSVWGGLYFTIEGLSLLEFNLPTYLIIIISMLIIASGVTVQYFISKELLDLPISERRREAIK